MGFRWTVGAALTVGAILLPAAPGIAQKRPAAPAEPFAEAYDFCMQTIDNDALDQAEATLLAAGWSTEILAPTGIAINAITAARTTGAIETYFYAEVTVYPTIFHSYCSYDMYGVPGTIDLDGVAERFQLDGGTEAGADGTLYGAWNLPLDEGLLAIFAYQEADYFRFQFNWFEWGAPRG